MRVTLGYLEENYPKLAKLVHERSNLNLEHRFSNDTIEGLLDFTEAEEGYFYWIGVSKGEGLQEKEQAL